MAMPKQLEDYVPVSVRLEKFREDHPHGSIITVLTCSEPITFRAEVYIDGKEQPVATGHACENGGMNKHQRADSIEKVETAAVGRALAFLGYEVKGGIASREEIQKWQEGQPEAFPTFQVVNGNGKQETKVSPHAQFAATWLKKVCGEDKECYDSIRKLAKDKGLDLVALCLEANEEGCSNGEEVLTYISGKVPQGA